MYSFPGRFGRFKSRQNQEAKESFVLVEIGGVTYTVETGQVIIIKVIACMNL